MEENPSISAIVVSVPANGASAGIAEGTEAAPDPTPMPMKHVGGSKPKRSFFDYIKICFRAYGAALVESLVGVPIVASAVTLGLYFSQPASG